MTDIWAPPGTALPRRPQRDLSWLRPEVVLIGALSLLVALTGSVVALAETSDPDLPLAATQRALDARVPALVAFVERERGLDFRRPVRVEVLGDDAFVDALTAGDHEAAGEGGDLDSTFTALGLVDPDQDLEALADESLSEGVVGFYDDQTERLVVRGATLDAYVELVVVHELTHALQDQVFDLDREGLDADDERGTAFAALVEGDATRVEQAWRRAQSTAVQQAVQAEEDRRFGDDGGDVSVIDLLLAFPYYAGEGYAVALLDAGGQAALDRAFVTPPTTTEQVLHPGAPAPPAVPNPAVDGDVLDEGVLGEQGLAILLGSDPTEDGPQVGWGGDRYVTYDGDDGPCTVTDVVMDTALDRDELLEALGAGYVDEVGGEIGGRGERGLRFTVCA